MVTNMGVEVEFGVASGAERGGPAESVGSPSGSGARALRNAQPIQSLSGRPVCGDPRAAAWAIG